MLAMIMFALLLASPLRAMPFLPWYPWLPVGYLCSSGDDNPTDHKHETFLQILPTVRQYGVAGRAKKTGGDGALWNSEA
jgi:hypothetical protein